MQKLQIYVEHIPTREVFEVEVINWIGEFIRLKGKDHVSYNFCIQCKGDACYNPFVPMSVVKITSIDVEGEEIYHV